MMGFEIPTIQPLMHILIFLVVLMSIRVGYLIYVTASKSRRLLEGQPPRTEPFKTMVVIGSGGHTMEMMSLMSEMNPNYYKPRVYLMADSDTTSEPKIHRTEALLSQKALGSDSLQYDIIHFPRSRHVGQSYFSSIFSTLHSTYKCIPIMYREKPGIVLCNGPGTCVPICIIAYLMRITFISDCIIIFMESVCRVKSLSLTGQILYYFVDLVLVQWRDLERKYPRTTFMGRV